MKNEHSNTNHVVASATQHVEHEPHAPVDLTIATSPREQKAYDAMLPRAKALAVDELAALNVDVPSMVATCVAVSRRLMPFRAFVASLPDFDVAALDELERAALALAVAHSDVRAATSPPDALADLVERGSRLRASFQIWGQAFADAGLLDNTLPETLRSGTGYKDLSFALVSWVRAFRAADWTKLKASSVLTDETLAEAEAIGQRIIAIVGSRELNPDKVAAVSDIRARMFTLALRDYDAVQRAVGFMRWKHGDAEEFAPSLYVKSVHHAAAHTTTNTATTPAAPTATSSSTTTAPTASPHAAPPGAPAPPQAHGAVGMHDSSPFTTD